MRIPVGSILIGNDHAPIDPFHVGHLTAQRIHDDRPVEVRPVQGITALNKVGDAWPLYEIVNGRHRFIAAMLRGAFEVECVIT